MYDRKLIIVVVVVFLNYRSDQTSNLKFLSRIPKNVLVISHYFLTFYGLGDLLINLENKVKNVNAGF